MCIKYYNNFIIFSYEDEDIGKFSNLHQCTFKNIKWLVVSHELTTTYVKATISRLKPQVLNYRNYKKFDERIFLTNIQQEYIECKSSDETENYEHFLQKAKNCN